MEFADVNHFISSHDVWFDEEFRLVLKITRGMEVSRLIDKCAVYERHFFTEESDLARAYQTYVYTLNSALVQADAKEMTAQIVSFPVQSPFQIQAANPKISEFMICVQRQRKDEAKPMNGGA